MALNLNAFKKLKPFFFGLSNGSFKGTSGRDSVFISVDGGIFVSKKECLNLVRPYLELEGNDDSIINQLSSNPKKINEALGKLIGELSKEQLAELYAAVEGKPLVANSSGQVSSQQAGGQGEPAQTLADSPARPSGGFGLPSSPPPPSRGGRIVYRNIPRAPETSESEIVKADRYGNVKKPVAPSETIAVAGSSGQVIEERPINPSAGNLQNPKTEAPKIQVADRFGNVAAEQPKLVLATGDGSIINPTAAPKSIAITDRGGNIVREHAIPTRSRFSMRGFKIPSSFKNLMSRVGVFFQRNIGKYATVGRVAAGVSGIIGGITGGALTGGSAMGVFGGAGLGAVTPSWIRSGGGKFLSNIGNRGINAFGSVSNQIARGKSNLAVSSGAKKKLALLLLGLLLLFILIGGIGGTSGGPAAGPTSPTAGTTPTTGGSCPDTSTNTNDATCQYLNPAIDIFNTSISQSSIDSYISKYGPVFTNAGKGDLAEFTKRVNYIVSSSQSSGLNPAIFLGYWKTESNFSTMGTRDLGCIGDNFYEEVDCALGINTFADPVKNPIANCARSKDANSPACIALKSVRTTFDKSNQVKYPIASFDDFAESYGPYSHLNDQGLHTNCTHTYNELIDVAKELNACTSSVAPPPITSTLSNILDWAQTINKNLDPSSTDRLLAAVTNGSYSTGTYPSGGYACTYFVVDSYNLAGIPGLSKTADGRVVDMENFWKSIPGYVYLDYQKDHLILKDVQPGFAMFQEQVPGVYTGNEHVSVVQQNTVDSHGNGKIVTLDSNASTFRGWTYTVTDWTIDSSFTRLHETITGFGGH